MSSPEKQDQTSERAVVNELLITQALDEKVENLNELTKAKLSAARKNALAKQQAPKESLIDWLKKTTGSLGVTGSLATSFSVLAIVFVMLKNPSSIEPLESSINEQQVLMAMMNPVLAEDPEMLDQLEFIAWLEQEGQDS